jgi:hypothetical protein
MSYLDRLRALDCEKPPASATDKADKSPSVGFVSDHGSHGVESEGTFVSSVSDHLGNVSGDDDTTEALDSDAIEERAGLADSIQPIYLDAWARLNHQKPECVSEARWRRALDDGGRFLDDCGSKAARAGWRPGELFDVTAGLIWQLEGEDVVSVGTFRVLLLGGRRIERWR